MDIRKADNSDLVQLSILFDAYRQFYGQTPNLDASTNFIRDRLLSKDSEILLAVREGEVIGFTQLYPSFSSVSMNRIFILNDLFVSLEVRKQGVGTALLKAAEGLAKEQGSMRLTLATAISNAPARLLYQSLGWKEDKAFVHYNLGLNST